MNGDGDFSVRIIFPVMPYLSIFVVLAYVILCFLTYYYVILSILTFYTQDTNEGNHENGYSPSPSSSGSVPSDDADENLFDGVG
jgi:hypothetical protein